MLSFCLLNLPYWTGKRIAAFRLGGHGVQSDGGTSTTAMPPIVLRLLLGSENSDDGRQGFFVGGSDRSGQEVLGPNRNNVADKFFDAIQQAGAEKLTHEQNEALNAQGQNSGGGSGGSAAFRLGGHGVESEKVGGTSTTAESTRQQASPVVVRLVLWTNGFSVNDGPLRQFQDPQNKEFLQAVMTKRIPSELIVPGREIDLRIEKKSTEYEPPKIKPFSGKGNQLVSVAPNVENSSDVVYVDAPPKSSNDSDTIPIFLGGITAVAVKGRNCVAFGVAKTIPTLQDEQNIRKIHALDSHVMVTFAVRLADARVLINSARIWCESYKLTLEDRVSLRHISRTIAGMSRFPMLVAGFDPDGTPRLFKTEPSGVYYELLAGSVGRNEKVVKEYLEKEYSNEKTANEKDTLKLLVKSLSPMVQSGPQNIEIAVIKWVDGSNGQPAHCEQRILSVEMIGALLNQNKSEQQQSMAL